MIKPLFICREFLSNHSPTGECARAFINGFDDRFFPLVYCSDKKPMIFNFVKNKCRVVHESNFVQYVAAAIRRVLIPDLTWLPGYEWWSWGKRCQKRILEDINKGEKFDYIHTISFPCACHTVGLRIKRMTGLPWIAQFYDPWADNPYRPFKTQFFKRIDWELEREVVENADVIIHDNEPIAELWKKRYGSEIAKKIIVLPLTVPLPTAEVLPQRQRDGETLTISHIGNFMLNRTSIPFINALILLFNEHPELRGKLQVNYIGMVTEKEKEMIQLSNLSDMFNLVGIITPSECEPYYKATDVFLAIDGVNKNNLFFPSKILKYLYYNKPILGITPKGSVLDYELHASGHAVFVNEDIVSIKNYLYRAITNYSSLYGFDSNYWQRFDPINVMKSYQEMIKERIQLSNN